MDIISYQAAKAVDKRLTDAIAANNNPAGWAEARDAINAKLADANRQSQTVANGVSVINASMDSPLDIEIQGRTLVSLGQSNLENGKNYVLADKKTKIRTDGRNGAQTQGVAKFAKTIATIRTANFVGKVVSSLTENPNKFAFNGGNTLVNPSSGTEYAIQFAYDDIKTLNGVSRSLSNSASGSFSQHLFSFNIIEEVERNIGRIPRSTTADKVQWLKDNLSNLILNWHGFGSSVGGNSASLRIWDNNASAWAVGGSSTSTSGTVAKISITRDFAIPAHNSAYFIDASGIVNTLAFAPASDGTTASTINTDYVELVITLNATAVLDTRPILSRVANFEGKVSGSTVDNPHLIKSAGGVMLNPSGFTTEADSTRYPMVSSLNGTVYGYGTGLVSGHIAQQLFSFNVIEEIERNLGRIPKATLAEKVAWVKTNFTKIEFSWYGYGSGPGGYKATVRSWSGSAWYPMYFDYHTSNTVSKGHQRFLPVDSGYIQSDGFVYFVAYAEPSDGTTASLVQTDYVELEIELKDSAVLHDPIVPLYEVDATEYANILVTWAEAEVLNRYPRVQGVQHLQNPYVIAEGENLLPPMTEFSYNSAMTNTITSAYEASGTGSTSYAFAMAKIPCVVGQDYYVKVDSITGFAQIRFYDANNASVGSTIFGVASGLTFKPPTNAAYILFEFGTGSTSGAYSIKNPILTLGTVAKPFVPRNPSYLFATTKLGQIGSVKDTLYKRDGVWNKRKVIEKDLELWGTTVAWGLNTDLVGYKRIGFIPSFSAMSNVYPIVTRYDGKIMPKALSNSNIDVYDYAIGASPYMWVQVQDSESGMGESYGGTPTEWYAYFNGWQAKTVDANGKPTAWRSLGDGTDAPTQTLAYVSANKAPNYTPYKLSYVLATPQIQTPAVEGDIAVNGPTQVEVGSGVIVREKVVPIKYQTRYYINDESFTSSFLKNRTEKILEVFADSASDKKWSISSAPTSTATGLIGKQKASISETDYLSTVNYYVSYLVFESDRRKLTNNALEVKGSYDTTLKSVVDSLVERQADIVTTGSINVQAIAELYKRVKALGG